MNEKQPFSLNEIPMGCLKYLDGFKTWFPNQEAWQMFANRNKNYFDENQGVFMEPYVTQLLGTQVDWDNTKQGSVPV